MATRREWIGLAVLMLPCLFYAMDLTILHLAVPAIAEEMRPSSAGLLWIVDIYGFMVAGALITMGSLGDRVGRRRMLLIGLAGFAVTSLLVAFSTSTAMLIAARALQGLAGASLGPSTLSLLRNMFHDERERATAIAIWVASFSVGAVLGPLIGGVILAHFHWGAVFLVNVPVMAAVFVLVWWLLPEFRDGEAGRIDGLSVVQSMVAVLAVVYGVKRFAEAGFVLDALAAIVTGLVVGQAFARRQRRIPDPLIDMKLFALPTFKFALFANLIDVIVVAGAFMLIAQYFQLVLGMGPLEAGLWTAPAGVTFVLGTLAVSWLLPRFSGLTIIAGGFLIAAVGFLVLALVGEGTPPSYALLGMMIFSAGLAPIGPITTELVVTSAPPERAGAASAISEMSFELGGAFGIALLGSLVTAIYRNGVGVAGAGIGLDAGLVGRAQETLAGAVMLARDLPPETGASLLAAARASFMNGFAAASAVACGLVLVSAAAARMANARGRG